MVSAVAALCLVAAFLEGAFSLTCYHCNTTGITCDGNDKLCDKMFDTCLTTLTEIRSDKAAGKPVLKSIVKSCGHKQDCNQTYSMSFNASYLHASTVCCQGDKCKTENIELPKRELKDNSVKCPSCNDLSTKCTNPITINCTAEENKCITYTASYGSPDVKYIARGCSTPNVCTMKSVSVLPFNQILMSPFACNHVPPLLPSLLFPAGFGFIMLLLLS
ncbi:phospholipase A2 inhibitor and Ly6/PLAUR domain-containing protein-like isoform X2 [Pseudophryne corroboree]|uniref:phospholipase A2 inhibitor and Ly6/PLAUR domain-containing protein-like isoform X2 n=1 Tax=Pseudophryne corroboree TaxID=495146 RepID=UPI0030814538